MGPGSQSSMGAGVQIRFGKDAKKPQKHKSSDEEQSDEEDEIMDRK